MTQSNCAKCLSQETKVGPNPLGFELYTFASVAEGINHSTTDAAKCNWLDLFLSFRLKVKQWWVHPTGTEMRQYKEKNMDKKKTQTLLAPVEIWTTDLGIGTLSLANLSKYTFTSKVFHTLIKTTSSVVIPSHSPFGIQEPHNPFSFRNLCMNYGLEARRRVLAGWCWWRRIASVACDKKILTKLQEPDLEVAVMTMLGFSLGGTRWTR